LVAAGVKVNWKNVNIDIGQDWWKFTSGGFAVYNNIAAFVFTLFIGFAMFYIYVMVGQLITSLIFDNFGVFGSEVHKADAWRICGLIIVLMSVVAVQMGKLHANKAQAKKIHMETIEEAICEREQSEMGVEFEKKMELTTDRSVNRSAISSSSSSFRSNS